MRSEIPAWHRIAAREKAESISRLAPAGTETVVEIGCGSGAVLEELDRLGFAECYWACEPTPELFEAIPRERISRLGEAVEATFDEAFEGRSFDLAILTHVVEHVRAPATLIAEAMDRARFVVIEVPIEDNVAGRARGTIKRMLGQRRLDNPSGHVQFFSRRTARALVHHAGGSVLAERAYFPYAPVAASTEHGYQRAVLAAAHIEWVGRRYYEHFAMLAGRAGFDHWNGHYVAPR